MATKEINENALNDLKRGVEITKDARFFSSIRLKRRQRHSTYLISILSIYVIALSTLPNIFKLSGYQNQILLTCSIILSVFIILTSLMDGFQNFHHDAELLQRCGRDIEGIHYNLRLVDVSEDPNKVNDQIKEIEKKYDEILNKCPINHETVDYYKVISAKPGLFPKTYLNENLFYILTIKGYYIVNVFIRANSWMFMHIVMGTIVTLIVYFEVIKKASYIE